MATPPSRSEVLALVLDELAAALEKSESPADITPDESTKLMGSNAPLDSVGLVSLIVGLEKAIEARSGIRLELADERAMSRRPSPFRNAGTMADHIVERIAAAGR